MCGDHEHGQRRCSCCDPAARRAARREARMREKGYDGDVDEGYASATVAVRADRAGQHESATYDPSPTVRAARARSGRLIEAEEDVLVGDDHPRVRAALARNPGTSSGALETLAADSDLHVREAVAAHPSTPPRTLAAMAASLDRRRDISVAQRLAANPHTPREALEGWLEGGTGGQRTLARAALRERARAAAESAAGGVLTGAEHIGAEIDEVAGSSADDLDALLGQGRRSAKVG